MNKLILLSVALMAGGCNSILGITPPAPESDVGGGSGAGGALDGSLDAGPDAQHEAGADVFIDSGCSPVSCEDFGLNCGLRSNGCGGTINCGQCAAPDVCGVGDPGRDNICGVSDCSAALENPAKLPILSGNNLTLYQALVTCVCHTSQTTNVCGYDAISQDMCSHEEVTWDFLENDLAIPPTWNQSIGPCVAEVCGAQLVPCENGFTL